MLPIHPETFSSAFKQVNRLMMSEKDDSQNLIDNTFSNKSSDANNTIQSFDRNYSENPTHFL